MHSGMWNALTLAEGKLTDLLDDSKVVVVFSGRAVQPI